MIFRMIGL